MESKKVSGGNQCVEHIQPWRQYKMQNKQPLHFTHRQYINVDEASVTPPVGY